MTRFLDWLLRRNGRASAHDHERRSEARLCADAERQDTRQEIQRGFKEAEARLHVLEWQYDVEARQSGEKKPTS